MDNELSFIDMIAADQEVPIRPGSLPLPIRPKEIAASRLPHKPQLRKKKSSTNPKLRRRARSNSKPGSRGRSASPKTRSRSGSQKLYKRSASVGRVLSSKHQRPRHSPQKKYRNKPSMTIDVPTDPGQRPFKLSPHSTPRQRPKSLPHSTRPHSLPRLKVHKPSSLPSSRSPPLSPIHSPRSAAQIDQLAQKADLLYEKLTQITEMDELQAIINMQKDIQQQVRLVQERNAKKLANSSTSSPPPPGYLRFCPNCSLKRRTKDGSRFYTVTFCQCCGNQFPDAELVEISDGYPEPFSPTASTGRETKDAKKQTNGPTSSQQSASSTGPPLKFCPNCGQKRALKDGSRFYTDKFCQTCGNQFPDAGAVEIADSYPEYVQSAPVSPAGGGKKREKSLHRYKTSLTEAIALSLREEKRDQKARGFTFDDLMKDQLSTVDEDELEISPVPSFERAKSAPTTPSPVVNPSVDGRKNLHRYKTSLTEAIAQSISKDNERDKNRSNKSYTFEQMVSKSAKKQKKKRVTEKEDTLRVVDLMMQESGLLKREGRKKKRNRARSAPSKNPKKLLHAELKTKIKRKD